MRLSFGMLAPILCAGTAAGHSIRPLAMTRGVAADLVTTVTVAQFRGLTVAFRQPPLMDPFCCRGAGGLSTLLLILPGIVAHQRGDARRARWYGVQTAMAFIADYVMIGSLSIFHGIDRLCATYTVASLTLRAWRGNRGLPPRLQGAPSPAREAPPPRRRRARVGCLAAGVPALWCKARGAKAATRGDAHCQSSSGRGSVRHGRAPVPAPPHKHSPAHAVAAPACR